MTPGEPTEQAVPDGAGDPWGQVFSDHRRRLLRFLTRRTGDTHAAEDLLQEAITRAVRHTAHGGTRPADALAWVYRVLRNVLVDYYLARDTGRRHQAKTGDPGDIPAPEVPLGQAKAVCRCVNAAVASLDADQRRWIHDVDLEGRSAATIADERGLTPGAGRVRLHRARVAVRRRVEQACGRCAEDGCADCTCRASGYE